MYGNSEKSFLLAVVVPAAEKAKEYATQQGWWQGSSSTKLATPEFTKEFQQLWSGSHGKEMKQWVINGMKEVEKPLKPFERVKDIYIESDIDKMLQGFNEANGCLTPTFKLKRPQLLDRYRDHLTKLYADNGEPDRK